MMRIIRKILTMLYIIVLDWISYRLYFLCLGVCLHLRKMDPDGIYFLPVMVAYLGGKPLDLTKKSISRQ